MKTKSILTRALAFMAFSFALPSFAVQKPTLKIAVAGPHSGANATFGMQEWRGASKAVKDINKAGGIMGHKLEVVLADDACEPKQAVAVANRMVDQDKVIAVVGHFCSSSTIPASEVYDDAGVLMITPASTNPKVTDRGLPTIMRMCGRDDQQGVVAGNFISERLKRKRVAVIHDKTTYGRGLADATKAQLKKHGIEPVLYEGLTIGEKDFNALVTKVRQVKADAVYFGGLHSEAGLLVRQIRDQGIKADFVSGDGVVSNEFVTSAGGTKYVDGVYVTFGPDPRNFETSKKVVEEFVKTEKYDPEGYTLYSYAAIQAISAALKGTKPATAKDIKGEKLATWLKNNPVDTVMGKKSWDKKGDLKSAGYVIYKWDAKGNYSELN